jgi:FtsP/CotA-like multicopper oxidase with cupredoxin domain
MEVNGLPVDPSHLSYRDDVVIPFWSGNLSDPYPSIKIRLDFVEYNVVGKFVYHCHIVGHEDNGMMAVIEVGKRGISNPLNS